MKTNAAFIRIAQGNPPNYDGAILMSVTDKNRFLMLSFFFSFFLHTFFVMQVVYSDWWDALTMGLVRTHQEVVVEWISQDAGKTKDEESAQILADRPASPNLKTPVKELFIGEEASTAMDKTPGQTTENEIPHLPQGYTEAKILSRSGTPDAASGRVLQPSGKETPVALPLKEIGELAKTLPIEGEEPVASVNKDALDEGIFVGRTVVEVPTDFVKVAVVPDSLFREHARPGMRTTLIHRSPDSNARDYGEVTFGIVQAEYAPYYRKVKDALGHYWTSFCREAARANLADSKDKLVLGFIILPSGETSELVILEHSTDPLIEKLWTRTVKESKIPPFPDNVDEPFIEIGIRYFFNR